MDNNLAILYVEDDLESREIMRLLVTEVMQIPELTIFADSTDFMDRITSMKPEPDVILLDIHMEPYDGFEMLKMLRKHEMFQNKPIIALTASVMNEEIQQIRNAGFEGVIPKPVDLDTFPSLLQQLINRNNIWHMIK